MKIKSIIISSVTAISFVLGATSASAQFNPNDQRIKDIQDYRLKPVQSPYFPNAKPNYNDLIQHSASGGICNGRSKSYLVTHATGINQATSRGTHFFTSFAKTGLYLDDKSNFYSDPHPVSFSDRVAPNGQIFDNNRTDVSSIIFNTAANTITVKSKTWNFSKTYSNLTRVGNRIIGSDKDGTIILNLKKAVDPCFQ